MSSVILPDTILAMEDVKIESSDSDSDIFNGEVALEAAPSGAQPRSIAHVPQPPSTPKA